MSRASQRTNVRSSNYTWLRLVHWSVSDPITSTSRVLRSCGQRRPRKDSEWRMAD